MIASKAIARYIRFSPYKVRQITRLLKGKTALHAMQLLDVLPKRPSGVLKKIIKSAIANATSKYQGIVPSSLLIKEIYVDEGPKLKRIRPNAFGRASIIRRRTCHVKIVLSLL